MNSCCYCAKIRFGDATFAAYWFFKLEPRVIRQMLLSLLFALSNDTYHGDHVGTYLHIYRADTVVNCRRLLRRRNEKFWPPKPDIQCRTLAGRRPSCVSGASARQFSTFYDSRFDIRPFERPLDVSY